MNAEVEWFVLPTAQSNQYATTMNLIIEREFHVPSEEWNLARPPVPT